MAIDFGILERTPTIASRFMAGQEAARAEQERNMLLQQRQMQFQQEQENRLRTQQREAQFEQMANLIREHGADPEDPQVLGKFAQAAFLSKQPQLASFVQSMMEHAAKRRQARAESEAVRNIMGGPTAALGAPNVPAGVAPSAAMPSAASMVASAAAAPEPMPAIPYSIRPGEVSPGGAVSAGVAPPVEVRLSAYGRGAPAIAAAPPSPPAGEINTAAWRAMAPVAPLPSELPINALAPEPAAAPANAMLAPPAAPAVRVAGPAALPTAAPKVDVAALETQLEGLQSKYDQLVALGTTAGNKAAATLKPQMDRISRQIERASKVTETAPAELRMMDALGIPRTEAGFARFNELKQRPEAMSSLARLIAERAKLAPNDPALKLYDDAIKKATTQVEGTKVEVKLPEQEKAFETELGKGQAKKLIDDKAVADDARSIIDTVQQGRQLLQSGMITGFGAEALTQIGAALNQAGISFASDSVANTQAFAANMAQNVGRIIKQFGAGTGLSNADREYAEKMAGGKITLDRKAIERILDINERAARNVITAHNKRVAGVKTNVPLTVELPPAMPSAPQAAPAGRPSLEQIFQPPKR